MWGGRGGGGRETVFPRLPCGSSPPALVERRRKDIPAGQSYEHEPFQAVFENFNVGKVGIKKNEGSTFCGGADPLGHVAMSGPVNLLFLFWLQVQ